MEIGKALSVVLTSNNNDDDDDDCSNDQRTYARMYDDAKTCFIRRVTITTQKAESTPNPN